MKRLFALLNILTLFVLCVAPIAFAGEGTAGDYVGGMGRNIGRGLWNVVSSPAEIPCTMRDDMSNGNAAAGAFTGFGKGLALMVRRIVVGVSEIGTFVMPSEATIPGVCAKK